MMVRASSGSRSSIRSIDPLMSANSMVTIFRSPSNSAGGWSAVLWLIDSGNSALAMGRRGDAVLGDDFSGAAHSPQKRAAGEFSNPHFAQSCLNGAAHWSQNFSPSGFSAPHFPQRTRSVLPPVKRRRMAEILFDALVYENRRERGAIHIASVLCRRSRTLILARWATRRFA